MKAITLLINSILPEDLQGDYDFSKKSIDSLMASIATKYPERYGEIAKKISDIGRNAAYRQGETLTLSDMRLPIDRDSIFKRMDAELDVAGTLSTGDKLEAARLKIFGKYAKELEDTTIAAAMANRNNLANTVVSGARGSTVQLRGMLTTPAMYTDYKGRTIPRFVRRSFGEGIRPADYLAGAFGVRLSVMSTKAGTADAGDLCLHEDTLVRMADGTTKPIRDIVTGDYVLGADTTGMTFPVRVTAKFDQGYKQVERYGFLKSGNTKVMDVVTCTENHKFLVHDQRRTTKRDVRPIGDLSSKSQAVPVQGFRSETLKCEPFALSRGFRPIAHLGPAGIAHCFDIEVDHADHLFVLASGVICSNSKQLIQSAANLSVTEDDCGTTNGISVNTDDRDTSGRVLTRDYAGFKAGTVVDKIVAQRLRSKGVKAVLARSPLTCQARQGVCAYCVGQLAGGKFPSIGYAAGITAAQAIAEPLTTGALSCLVSGTCVRMADFSVRPVEAISPGEWVLGADHTGMTFPVQVTGKFDQGVQPANRYEFKYGATRDVLVLESTSIHPILANTKTSNCGTAAYNHNIRELPVGTKLYDFGAVLPTSYSGPPGVDEPLAFIAGLLVGDGCYTQAVNTVHLSCADESLIHYLEEYLPPLGLKVVPHKGNDIYYRISMVDQQNARSVSGQFVKCGPQSPIRKFLISRGMHGKYAHEKSLPRDIWTWSDTSVLEFLGGLFSADGSVYETKKGVYGVSLGMTSQSIVMEVKALLELRFCVYSTPVYYQAKAGKGTAKHDMWSIVITRHEQIDTFRNLVRMQGVKAKRLKAFKLKPRKDTFFRRPRKTITPLGPQQTWDLEVDHPAGLFVLANGLIVHNTKHEAGAFKGERRAFAGFDVINQIMQSPETFPHRAAVAELDGRVEKIEDAPQGGKFITVGGQRHYSLPGYGPLVKPGDDVEVGDALSDGIVDVNDMVRLRGLGEGRRYYVDRVQQALADSGAGNASRRNLELIARGALDHVRITNDEGVGDYLPEDVASYNRLVTSYSPPAHVRPQPIKKSLGLYLHQPALHYTIGTRLSPRMVKELGEAGVENVTADLEAPPFIPEMVRLRGSQFSGTDWLAKFHSSNLGRNIGLDAERARDTNIQKNIHFVPRLAAGVGFGENVAEAGEL